MRNDYGILKTIIQSCRLIKARFNFMINYKPVINGDLDDCSLSVIPKQQLTPRENICLYELAKRKNKSLKVVTEKYIALKEKG